MNSFEYQIYENVYNDIVEGNKTIEFRLLNEKSNSVNIGDEIKFIVLNNKEKYILVEVVNKYIYNNIEDLWEHKQGLNNILIFTREDFINNFCNIFGEEKVFNSKIVGIEFKIKKIR